MPWRHPDSRAQQVAPKSLAGEGARRRRSDPWLPGWSPRALRPAGDAGRPKRWTSQGGSEWWQASSDESWSRARGEPARSPPTRMPPLPAAAQKAARRSGLKSLLLPPRFLDRAPWTRVLPSPEPGERGKDRRGLAKEAKDPKASLSALLGQFIPNRFQKFLRKLGAQWVEQLEPQSEARGVGCQSLNCQNNLKKVSNRIPTLGPLRKDHTQFKEVKKTNTPCGRQAPKLKTALVPGSSEAPGPYRRCSPFRVRFADETVQDTAFRYWERKCALQQGITRNRRPWPAPLSETLEPMFGSIRRWLENLPKTLSSRPRREATAGWDCPVLPMLGRQNHLCEDSFSSSSRRWRRDPKAILGTHDILSPVGKPPCSWSQQLESFLPPLELKRGRPKGY